jgi:hypothetical protein
MPEVVECGVAWDGHTLAVDNPHESILTTDYGPRLKIEGGFLSHDQLEFHYAPKHATQNFSGRAG